MEIEEMIALLDDWVNSHRKESLDALEKEIIRKTLDGETYDKMLVPGFTTGYIKTMAAPQLWNFLTILLGDRVTKKSLRLVLEPALKRRQQELARQNYPAPPVSDNRVSENTNTQTQLESEKIDWGEAPELSVFYGQADTLKQLEKSIVKDKCKLVAIFGMSGIGKTAVSVKLVEKIQDSFDKVIWRSLQNAPLLDQLFPPIIPNLSNNQETVLPKNGDSIISQLIQYLKDRRCLLVLDELEAILSDGDSSGTYREGYEDYGNLLKRIGQERHQSCLLLTSRAPTPEIQELVNPRGRVRELQLKGLGKEDAKQFLEDRGFSSTKNGLDQLIASYNGHPLALKMAAKTIHNCHNGNIPEFLKGSLFVHDIIIDLLDREFRYLSNLEREIIKYISEGENQQVSAIIENFYSPPKISTGDIQNSVNNLLQRGLIDKKDDGENNSFLTVDPVIKKYVKKSLSKEGGNISG